MDPNQNYFYVPLVQAVLTEEQYYQNGFTGEYYINLTEGMKIDERVVIDDRIKTPVELVQEGKYITGENILLSNVILNPHLYF